MSVSTKADATTAASPHPRSGEPLLAVDELQGNGLAGLNKPFQIFVFLQTTFSKPAREWLYRIANRTTSLRTVLEYRELRKTRADVPAACWLNVGLSFQGLRRLSADADAITDNAFREGMSGRWLSMDDARGPSTWVLGGSAGTPDVILILAHDEPDQLKHTFDQMAASLPPDVTIIHTDRGGRIPGDIEHFGYRDGISQPGIRGRVPGKREFLTATIEPLRPNEGKPGQPLVWPGEFAFGYPEEHPSLPLEKGDAAVGGPMWMKNGSFLTYQRLRQNVSEFRRCCEDISRQVRKSAALEWFSPHAVGARLIGRWRSGAPVVISPQEDNPALGLDDKVNDLFQYSSSPDSRIATDARGERCPFSAHIRKVNPRNELGLNAHRHRLVRRGIAFGPPFPFEGERGLLFLAYQTSIERQFEFVMRRWVTAADFPVSETGVDPVLGEKAHAIALSVRAGGKTLHFKTILSDKLVLMTGGEHFFSPSISALKMLAS